MQRKDEKLQSSVAVLKKNLLKESLKRQEQEFTVRCMYRMCLGMNTYVCVCIMYLEIYM